MTGRAARDVRPLAHAALGASALFQDYSAGAPAALDVYRWDPWSASDRADAARVAADRDAHRDAVADVLAEQNRAWGAGDDVLSLVERLRQPDAVAVVTGQQLGLFAGPLYTPYKALTAVRLAARLAAETGRPAVPVFWLADEDHDFAEIQRTAFAEGPDVRFVTYDDGRPPDDNRGPVGRLVLEGDALGDALDQLERALPDGPHRDEALALARSAYRPGRTMRDAFALLLRSLVPGIVLMSADDARLKRLGVPLFHRELASWEGTYAALEARSGELERAGYHAQVQPSPLNLFWIAADGRRLPLDPVGHPSDAAGARFELRGGGEAASADEWAARFASAPERVSPNVVLRPLLQDLLLPTAAYVAGPGEAAYFAQLGPVYERFDVPMPVIEPRLSLTVLEPGVAKVLDRYGLALPDLSGDLAPVWRRLSLAASDVDLDAAFADARQRLDALLADLDPVAQSVDGSLESAVGAARARAVQALDRLETKTVRVEKRNHTTIRERLERAQAALWPGGALQERALGPLGVVARHGVDGLQDLVRDVPLDASVHHTVRP